MANKEFKNGQIKNKARQKQLKKEAKDEERKQREIALLKTLKEKYPDVE